MAQHDYVIDNQASAAARTDLNNLFQAIVSQNSGDAAPATTYANMLWYETDTNTLWKRNEANSGWISMGVLDEAAGTFTPSGGPAIATQAEAEAGTNNTKMMTPLRVEQAINVQAEGMILLGTLTTTSGTTQTLSGLTLTGYKRLLIDVSGVSHDNANQRNILVGTARMCDQRNATDLLYGTAQINLSDGTAVSHVDTSSTNARNTFIQLSGYTNASTSIVFSWSGTANFDAGTIRVYGVR